jgi:hypothetical protein
VTSAFFHHLTDTTRVWACWSVWSPGASLCGHLRGSVSRRNRCTAEPVSIQCARKLLPRGSAHNIRIGSPMIEERSTYAKSTRRLWRAVLGLSLVGALVSCVPWLRVRVLPDERPRFTARGTLTTFFRRGVERLRVFGVPPGTDPQRSGVVQVLPEVLLWELRTVDGRARAVEKLRYGEIPTGFIQWIPPAGQAPPELQSGWTYKVVVNGDGTGYVDFDYRGDAITPAGLRGGLRR